MPSGFATRSAGPLAFVLAILAPIPAAAQTQGDDEAKQASVQALEAFNAKDYTRARDLYIRVVSLKASAESFWALARCHEELGDPDKALLYLAKAAEASPSPARLKKIVEKQAALRIVLETPVEVPVTCEPVDSDLALGGASAGKCPTVLRLRPGSYSLKASRAGFREALRNVQVRPGLQDRIVLRLEPIPALPVQTPEAPQTGRSVFGKWWFWTLVGTAVTGSVVATVVILKTRDGKTVPARFDGKWSIP